MFIVAQIIGILLIILNVISMQLKNKKNIVFVLLIINLLAAINLMMLGSYTGSIICFFAAVQVIINSFFERKNKEISKVILGFYVIISITCGVITYKTMFDILPIISSILFTITIIQKKEKNIRRIHLINMSLWVVYDFISAAYTNVISDSITLVSDLVGIYRFDIRKNDNNKK